MIENKFFRMLFDYRGTISRRQYWGSLLFLLFMLSTSNLIQRWDLLENLLGIDRYNSIQSYNFDVYLFLTYLCNALFSILYFSTFAVALSSIIVTLKRSKTLGYSKLTAWLFAMITYIAYFSLSALSNYYQYKRGSSSYSYSEGSDITNIDMAIPIGLISIGLFIILAIMIVILLSRKTDMDYEEDINYYEYDSISCVYGLAKFSISYTIILLCAKYTFSWIGIVSPLLIKTLALALIISYIYFYLNIFIKRSRDANVNSIYIICAFILIIVTIVLYLFSMAMSFFDNNPILSFFINYLCFLIINIYIIGTYILIALPSRSTEYIDPN